MMEVAETEESGKSWYFLQYAENSRIDAENIVYVRSEKGGEIELVLSLNAFLHGRNIHYDTKTQEQNVQYDIRLSQ